MISTKMLVDLVGRMRPLFVALAFGVAVRAGAAGLNEFAGRYILRDGTIAIVAVREQTLTIRPIFWTSLQWLRRVDHDRFVVTDRADRTVQFERDSSGRVNGALIVGIDGDANAPRAGPGKLPVELLFNGNPEAAARGMLEADPTAVDRYVGYGERLATGMPSRVASAVSFLSALRGYVTPSAHLERVLADALVARGDRESARQHYRRALDLNPSDADATRGLRMLASAEPDQTGWRLPFSLRDLFADPRPEEIAAVKAQWSGRDLRAHEVQIVRKLELDLGFAKAEVRIVTHRIHGAKHYVAIIVPRGATDGCCPIIIDAKGVSWDYAPRRLDSAPDSAALMESDQKRFVYVVPSHRGEVLIAGGDSFTSEGDRTDAWDGAVDDAIASLSAAVEITPEADRSRVCIFGRSRGGTVALLAAERDPRILCAVAWAAPTDHFRLMGQDGWTVQESVAEGLRQRATPDRIGGQFIETFLRAAVSGERDLSQTRRHMLASSPLYFADRLPRMQLHYGIDDAIVPVVNGRELAMRRKANLESYFYPGFGHDTDRVAAYRSSRRFLIDVLLRASPAAK
jgi:tetratricopeptide (TPR) repeat protein